MTSKDGKVAFRMNLEVVLTQQELNDRGRALASELNKREGIGNELNVFKAQKKSEIASVDNQIARNRLLINTGKEFRMVECDWIYDWKNGKKTAHRNDTGEVVGREDITDDERQLDFAPEEGKKKVEEEK